MEHNRFDTLTQSLATGLSRRTALRGLGGAGLAALGATGLNRAAAQESTPAATPASLGLPEGERTEFLFVQTFGGGTWEPKDGEEGVYTLTLTAGIAQTVYFSDRPERIVGTLPTQQFLDGLGFAPENPPNAALVAQTEAGEDVLVIELLNPRYDEAAGTLTYDARVLENYQEEGLAFVADQQDELTMPDSFGAASLFIDDCPDAYGECYVKATGQVLGRTYWGCCWQSPWCVKCHPDQSDADLCAYTWGAVCGGQGCGLSVGEYNDCPFVT